MQNKTSAVTGAALAVILGISGQASAECLRVVGIAGNNAQPDGTTMGVAVLRLGTDRLTCGLRGVPQDPAPPNFRHTIVCHDDALPDEAFAQVTLNTSFVSLPGNVDACPPGSPGGPESFSFQELSVPDPTSATGAFAGVTDVDSFLLIGGDFNCQGGISMRFSGQMCFAD